ncbi:hypothetical protein OH76DRAFT_647176 [Lentinus brumalis]|uniref:Uncharacterized protein n=1 Tax=Lentinus brumalis TaxID=2498619 RepID=A0A371D830_9APHY|nr:hypothetical protein OH76DRAFT_647176 [Polyporus brumalis]
MRAPHERDSPVSGEKREAAAQAPPPASADSTGSTDPHPFQSHREERTLTRSVPMNSRRTTAWPRRGPESEAASFARYVQDTGSSALASFSSESADRTPSSLPSSPRTTSRARRLYQSILRRKLRLSICEWCVDPRFIRCVVLHLNVSRMGCETGVSKEGAGCSTVAPKCDLCPWSPFYLSELGTGDLQHRHSHHSFAHRLHPMFLPLLRPPLRAR